MKNLHNIEQSGFRKGEYVGYALGTIWRITRTNSTYGNWLAIPRDADKVPRESRAIYATRLADLSRELDSLA